MSLIKSPEPHKKMSTAVNFVGSTLNRIKGTTIIEPVQEMQIRVSICTTEQQVFQKVTK